jgi:hypothetical protein
LYFQLHRKEESVYRNIAHLWRTKYGRKMKVRNVPNKYLQDARVFPPRLYIGRIGFGMLLRPLYFAIRHAKKAACKKMSRRSGRDDNEDERNSKMENRNSGNPRHPCELA